MYIFIIIIIRCFMFYLSLTSFCVQCSVIDVGVFKEHLVIVDDSGGSGPQTLIAAPLAMQGCNLI